MAIPQNLCGSQRGPNKSIVPPQAPLFTYTLTHTYKFTCIPSGLDKVAISLRCGEAGILIHKFTNSPTHGINAAVRGLFVPVCGIACARGLSVCSLSPLPCINQCPPSNEDERTDSLNHLVLQTIEPSEGMTAGGREKN